VSERPLLSISRKSLDEGTKELRAALPAAWLTRKFAEVAVEGDAVLTAKQDGKVDLRLTPSGGDNFLLQGKATATVETTCGRCLGPASLPVASNITLLLVPDEAAVARQVRGRRAKDSEGEFEFDRDEADVATYDGETVVLDDLVRDEILLEIPMIPLCSETCPGMGTPPGTEEKAAEKGIDPRLAPLMAFRGKK
jgi:uncharacterized protein